MLRKWIEAMVKAALVKYGLQTVMKLDPKNQYIFLVQTDEVAKELVSQMKAHMDFKDGPQVLVIVADDMRLLEICKKST